MYMVERERGREEGREGEREMEGGREGEREMEGGREGGREERERGNMLTLWLCR